MRRALKALISLYPKTWRNRYQNEFCALLDDVPPTWRTLFNVFGGALKMQMTAWSPWKIVAAFAVVGAIAAIAFSLAIPSEYVSRAIVKIGDAGRAQLVGNLVRMESRANLTRLINEEDLYKNERAHMPMEDVIEQMKKDIMVTPVKSRTGELGLIAISFASPDAARAQRITQRLTSQFLDVSAGTMLDPASLPIHPTSPKRLVIIAAGLVAGVLAGALFVFFNGLKVWKIAAGLGIAGGIAGAAVAFVLPERFASAAVIWYQAPDLAAAGDRISQMVTVVKSDASLREIVQRFNLYPNEPGRERRLMEHLHIEIVKNDPAVVIRFEDRDRYIAQKVVADVVGRLMEESLRSNIRTGSQVVFTLELLDPPTLPQNAYFPNRPMVAGTGFFLGLVGATLLGVWRHFKRSLAVVAA
jgi:capsular polysaccharide biosynthesis protein